MPGVIRDMPEDERPAYRLRSAGASALSDAEVVALVANLSDIQTARDLLDHFGGLRPLSQADVHAIQCAGVGIGPVRAMQIHAAFEFSRRIFLTKEERFQAFSPSAINVFLRPMIGNQVQEHFVVVCLDTKNRVLKVHTVYIGSLNAAMIRVSEVYREPIRVNASAIIVAHNHPSQDPTPSPEDILVTNEIVKAGKLLNIECLDHLIVCSANWASMRERGLGFPL